MNLRYMVVREYGEEIYELEIGKETEKFLWYTRMCNIKRPKSFDTHTAPGLRIPKSCAYHATFKSIEEAVEHIRQRYARRIEGTEESVKRYKEQSEAFEKTVQSLMFEAYRKVQK